MSLLSVCASLFAGRQARAWFDPNAQRPGVSQPQKMPVAGPIFVAPVEIAGPRRRRSHVQPREQALPSATLTAPLLRRESQVPSVTGPNGELALFDVNGGRSIRVRPFGAQGLPSPIAFDQLKEFMRCRRSGQALDMNASLVALLASIANHFDGAVLHVISGHRVADDVTTRPSSQHTRGTAADIRIPGVDIENLAAAAHELGARGVGVYPLSRFVHVDVRTQPYYWRDVGTGAVATRAPL